MLFRLSSLGWVVSLWSPLGFFVCLWSAAGQLAGFASRHRLVAGYSWLGPCLFSSSRVMWLIHMKVANSKTEREKEREKACQAAWGCPTLWWEKLQSQVARGLGTMKKKLWLFVQSTWVMYGCSFNYTCTLSVSLNIFKIKVVERDRRQHKKPDTEEIRVL